MFRLSRTKPAKPGETVDFRFSNFKVLQVPKGWDKLYVSLVSVEIGKTITKSSKAIVRNGSCQWTDTLSEAIWFPQNEASKEREDCQFKFVVSMGSAKSGILGEATINVTGYMSSSDSISVSLPLKKSNNGTILQVKIQCLALRAKLRDGESKETSSHVEDLKVDSHDTDVKSDLSDNVRAHGVRSSSNKDMNSAASASHPGEPERMATSLSAYGSHHSYDSTETFLSINVNGIGHNLRQDCYNSHGNYPVDDASQSHQSLSNSRRFGLGNHLQNNCQEQSNSSFRMSSSSTVLLDTAEDGGEELRAEAKMWEKNARKLMLDLDSLRKEFSDQSKNQANLDKERDGLRQEVERLKLLLDKSKPVAMEDLENEIKFQRESNANLSVQLKRSQESNVELVSLLQELELEKSVLQVKFNDVEKSFQEKMEENAALTTKLQQVHELEKNPRAKKQTLEHASEDKRYANESESMEVLKDKVQELERDCNELTDENLELLFRLKEVNNNSTGVCTCGSSSTNRCTKALTSFEDEMRVQKAQRDQQAVNQNKKVLGKFEDGCNLSVQVHDRLKIELELKVIELGTKLNNKRSKIQILEANLMSKEEAIVTLRQNQVKLEDKVVDLEKEKSNLEQNMKALVRENDINTDDLCTHHSANMYLERKCLELESGKGEMQLRLSELEEENVQLSECISSLEAQLRHLMDENESGRLELEHSKSLVNDLRDEITTLRNGMETQEAELKQLREHIVENLSSALEDIVSKEKRLEALMEENQTQNKKLTEEVENLEYEVLTDHENVVNASDKYRSSEEKLKSVVNSLELKLTISEYERQQLLEEIANLKNDLDAMKFEKEKLEASLHLLSREYEGLKAENTSNLQMDASEFEDCKQNRAALEEKLLHMESDLNRISRANNQFQRKIQQLEKDKNDHITKSRTLGEELKIMKEEKQNQREPNSLKIHNLSKTNAKVSPIREDSRFSKNEIVKGTNHHRDSKRKPSLKNDQVQELVKDRQKPCNIQHHKEGGNGHIFQDQHPQAVVADPFSKIQLLENELAQALEANKTYEAQLNRLMSPEGRDNHCEGELVAKERFERTKSVLETELKDIRERYLHMSLQYAEVEAEREQLVMKLKAAKNGKRWFS